MTFTIKQQPAILEGTVFCHEHECPLITVVVDGENHSMCLFEALDELIGQESISRVHISEEGYLSELVFSNGYHIHPLCICCGKSTLSIGAGNEQALQWGSG